MSANISNIRRKRGVVCASITKLCSRLAELEEMSNRESANYHAQHLSTRLNTLDSEFKSLHFKLVNVINDGDNETMASEQSIIYKHKDVDTLSV